MARTTQRSRKKTPTHAPNKAGPSKVQKPANKVPVDPKRAINFVPPIIKKEERSGRDGGDSSSETPSSGSSSSSSDSSDDSGSDEEEEPAAKKVKTEEEFNKAINKRVNGMLTGLNPERKREGLIRQALLDKIKSMKSVGPAQEWHKYLTEDGKEVLGYYKFWAGVKERGLKLALRYDATGQKEILTELGVNLQSDMSKAKGKIIEDILTDEWCKSEFSKLNKKWEGQCSVLQDRGSLKSAIKELKKDLAEHELRARVEWAISDFVKARKE